jgi:hypothetical protein
MAIDSRPSDALALAVRVHVPVFVDEEVMEAASTEPEEDIEAEIPEGEESEERLEVFKDFVESLDLGNLDDEEDAEGDE